MIKLMYIHTHIYITEPTDLIEDWKIVCEVVYLLFWLNNNWLYTYIYILFTIIFAAVAKRLNPIGKLFLRIPRVPQVWHITYLTNLGFFKRFLKTLAMPGTLVNVGSKNLNFCTLFSEPKTLLTYFIKKLVNF